MFGVANINNDNENYDNGNNNYNNIDNDYNNHSNPTYVTGIFQICCATQPCNINLGL